MNRLRIPISRRARKLKGTLGFGCGPEGRIERLRKTVTELVRHERLEGNFGVLDESRGYTELLIQQAALHGPEHAETMEMVQFWLLDKDLVHKLFNVLVPRYSNHTSSYTEQYQLPTIYPQNQSRALLELKGNPWPPVIEDPVDTSKWINNVLLTAAKTFTDTTTVASTMSYNSNPKSNKSEGSSV